MTTHPHSHVAAVEAMGFRLRRNGPPAPASLDYMVTAGEDDEIIACGFGPTPEAAALDALATGWLLDLSPEGTWTR